MTGFGGLVTSSGSSTSASQVTVRLVSTCSWGKTMQQSLMGSNRFAADIPLLVEHALAGRIDLDAMVSEDHSIEELPEVLDRLESGQVLGRAVINF